MTKWMLYVHHGSIVGSAIDGENYCKIRFVKRLIAKIFRTDYLFVLYVLYLYISVLKMDELKN